MAKLVLIQFDNDDDAEGFIETLKWEGPTGAIQVRGVFKAPTMFCQCPTPSEKSVRGAKWGWWLCKNAGCGKPKPGQFQQPRNLIEAEGTRPEHRRIWINVRMPL